MRRATRLLVVIGTVLVVASEVALATSMTGTNQSDTLSGTSGDDQIAGGGKNDTVKGQAGNDNLFGD